MSASDLIEMLAEHKRLGAAPREELAWLASHATVRKLEPGDVLNKKGVPVEGLVILISGRISITVDRGAGPQKVMEWLAGDVLGLLPYSRLVSPPGDTVAQESTVVVAVHRDHLREMTRECHQATSTLVHCMLDRARAFTSSDLQNEKMISLGKLSAGLAHELNNPTSAIERSASLLAYKLEEAESASRSLGAHQFSEPQQAAVDAIREACLSRRSLGVLSPIDEAEREDALADWLVDHGVDIEIAEALAETGVTIEALDRTAAVIDGQALNDVLRSAAANWSVRGIAQEIQEAATRISGLVSAVKGFTHMDQAAVAEPVDLTRGLTNTVAVLKAKARSKAVTVNIEVAPDIPKVWALAGELNQIWANLIDNALDAVAESGRVDVVARLEGQRVVVSIVDDGPGIPEPIRSRIFDPFFTTKKSGQGTGLGLDIVRRLINHNDGEIEVESQPGRTEFRLLLPVAAADEAGKR